MSKTETYEIGSVGENVVYVNPIKSWSNLKVFDPDGNELFDLEKHGFTHEDMLI